MKKLMVFAAVAAAMSGSVFANLCEDDPAEAVGCSVYTVQFKLKVPVIKGKVSAQDCSDDQLVCWLEKGSVSYDGILWTCSNTCDELTTEMGFVMWDKKAKAAVTDQLSWNGTNWTASSANFDVLDRFGKKATIVEAYWTFDLSGTNGAGGTITAAGWGTYNTKKSYVTSVSGYAVGTVEPSSVTIKCQDCAAVVCDLCTEFSSWATDGTETDKLVVWGTWCMKYSTKYSSGNYRLSQIVPAYAQEK